MALGVGCARAELPPRCSLSHPALSSRVAARRGRLTRQADDDAGPAGTEPAEPPPPPPLGARRSASSDAAGRRRPTELTMTPIVEETEEGAGAERAAEEREETTPAGRRRRLVRQLCREVSGRDMREKKAQEALVGGLGLMFYGTLQDWSNV